MNPTYSRWVSLTAGLFLMLAGGHPYGFGAYSSALKEVLGYSQAQLNIASSLGNLGMYLGVAGGYVCDVWGPKLTALCGALFALIGYTIMWYTTQQTAKSPDAVFMSPMLLGLLMAFAWQSGPWLDCSGVAPNLKNFPSDRGSVTGLLKSFFGLSGSIIAQLYLAFFAGLSAAGELNVLLMIGGLVAVVACCAAPFISVTHGSHPPLALCGQGKRRLLAAYFMVMGLCLFLAVVGCVHVFPESSPKTLPSLIIAGYLALFALLPLGAPSCQVESASLDVGAEENADVSAGTRKPCSSYPMKTGNGVTE